MQCFAYSEDAMSLSVLEPTGLRAPERPGCLEALVERVARVDAAPVRRFSIYRVFGLRLVLGFCTLAGRPLSFGARPSTRPARSLHLQCSAGGVLARLGGRGSLCVPARAACAGGAGREGPK